MTILGHKKILAGRRLTNLVLIEEKIKIFSEVLAFHNIQKQIPLFLKKMKINRKCL